VSGVRENVIPAFSLRRPVTVMMAFAALLVMGVIAWRSIDLELLPAGFTPPFLFVQIPTLASSPEEVEQRIAIPTEEMLATVRNLERLGTRVRSNSASFIMGFRDGTDMDDAYNQVRDRVERVIPDFGDDIGQYFIWKYNPADDPVVWFGVTFGDDADDPGRLIDDWYVPRIERIAGVSRVEVSGAPQRVVSVQVDERLVNAAGLSMFELVRRMTSDNFSMSTGTIEQAQATMPLRVVARYDSLERMRMLPVGGGLRLDDIADVVIEDRAERSLYRINQRQSIWLAVYKESTANTVDVVRAVHEVVEALPGEHQSLEEAEAHYFFDQGEIIESSLGNLQRSALQGALFAIAVLFIFLRSVRMTLLVTSAIPTSMLLTLVAMYFTGGTLNVLSLMGLMLVVGMVVDNAIVVVESVQRYRQAGQAPMDAALHGASDVALAIMVSTATTIVVFVPIILMSGDQMLSFYLGQIGFPVCVGLVASLVVALTLLPLATSRLAAGKIAPRPVAAFVWLEKKYGALLRWTLTRRLESAAICAALFLSTFYPMKKVTVTDQSEPNISDFRIYVDMPQSLTWEERVEVMTQYEQILWDKRAEFGIDDLMVRIGGRWGAPQLRAFLVDEDQRPLGRDEVIEAAMAALPPLPGISLSVSWRGGADASREVNVSVAGPDSRRLAEIAEEISRRLRYIEGVTSVRAESSEDGQPEMLLQVDRERSVPLGLNPATVGGTVDFALRGRQVGQLQQELGEIPVYVEGATGQANELSQLRSLQIPSLAGPVTLDSVADFRVSPGFRGIDRENRRTSLSLTIQTSREDLQELSAEIQQSVADYPWPRGYGLSLGGRFQQVEEGSQDRVFALILSITFVFLLMGVLFESFVLPLSIVLSIPFAFTGVYWALYLAGQSLDVMAGVGLVILVGIVVNNAIVLVDVVGEKRRQGETRLDALVNSGQERLRPILMTALTTIFGLIPMAFGNASLVGVPYKPLGLAVMGGLVASTVLTLVVVPLFYTFFDDLSRTGRAWVSKTLGSRH
jgi:HAE1 family hydrophobic/amphiphilic exporter-1